MSIYRFIDAEKASYPVSALCRYFGFQEAATMSGKTVHPPTETVKTPLSLSGFERFTNVAEKPMATPQSPCRTQSSGSAL